MKKLVCFLLVFFIVFTVYADTTYTAMAGENEIPAEFKLQAYKNSTVEIYESLDIKINDYVENENGKLISDSEQNRFYISADLLDGNHKLFDIVYSTNTFNNHVTFTVDIPIFKLEGDDSNKIDVTPKIEMSYSFNSIVEGNRWYQIDANKQNYDVESYPTSDTFKSKYNNSLKGYDLNSMLNLASDGITIESDSSGKFKFKCYPSDTYNGVIEVIRREGKYGHYRQQFISTAVFTASAYVSSPDNFDTANYNGRYVMSVNIKAEISGS